MSESKMVQINGKRIRIYPVKLKTEETEGDVMTNKKKFVIEIPDGYFRRQDQSMAFPLPGKGLLTCPYCKRKVTRLYGYEHKSLPDIEMCSTCMELYAES